MPQRSFRRLYPLPATAGSNKVRSSTSASAVTSFCRSFPNPGTVAEAGNSRPKSFPWGIEKPEGYYYQGAYADVLRAVDYLISRPDVDADRIGALGSCQAGGIMLAVGSLDPRIKAIAAHVPNLIDMRHAIHVEGSLVNRLKQTPVFRSEHLDTLDYFDALEAGAKSAGGGARERGRQGQGLPSGVDPCGVRSDRGNQVPDELSRAHPHDRDRILRDDLELDGSASQEAHPQIGFMRVLCPAVIQLRRYFMTFENREVNL